MRLKYVFQRVIFFLLISTSTGCLISSFYCFFVRDLQLFSVLFLTLFVITLALSLIQYQSNRNIFNIDEKRFIKKAFPPFLTLFLSNLNFGRSKNKSRRALFFDGDEDLFRSLLNECSVYGEYGMGASTVEALQFEDTYIYSVDSDREWVLFINGHKKSQNHFLEYIDLGEVIDWGYPKDYSKRENITNYLDN